MRGRDSFENILLQWGHGGEAVESMFVVPEWPDSGSLQWGHGGEAVESMGRTGAVPTGSGLQWGHGGEAVESGGRLHAPADRSSGFNGATAVKPWSL